MNPPESVPEQELQALLALDDMSHRTPDSAEEETLRVKAKLVKMYGWEGYQKVMRQMELDLARLERHARFQGN